MRAVFLSFAVLRLLGGAPCASAVPVHMVCKGQNYFQAGPKQARTVEATVSVTVFMDRAMNIGVAQVGEYKEVMVLQMPADKNVVTIVGDRQKKSGLQSGTINRVSGEMYLDLGLSDGLPKSFIGICHPA